MTGLAVANVLTGPRAMTQREFPLPDIGADDGLLRIEACGICGTDVEQYLGHGSVPRPYPMIPGHEPVGVIEAVGDRAAARWGVDIGDRVAIEPFIPCGGCGYCLTGRYEHCAGWGRVMAYGFLPTDLTPTLWGGYATHLYLHPGAVIHPVPAGITPELAVLFNPLGAGVRWAVTLPGTGIGDVVAVLGPGQRGLSAVIAARAAGAGTVIVTGLTRDRHKLDLAVGLGADHAIDVESEPLTERFLQLTGGRLADIVVDVTAGAPQAVGDAVALARPGGTIVLGGLKSRPVPAFDADDVVLKGLTIIGARGVDYPAYREALALIEGSSLPLDQLRSHTFGLADAATAVEVLAGEHPGEEPVNVVITPNG